MLLYALNRETYFSSVCTFAVIFLMYYPFVFLSILSIEKVPPNPSLSFFFAKKCLPTLSKPKGKRNYKCYKSAQKDLHVVYFVTVWSYISNHDNISANNFLDRSIIYVPLLVWNASIWVWWHQNKQKQQKMLSFQ